jgi:hypothetical protein
MRNFGEQLYWLASAVLALGFFAGAGYYGWASIIIWTVLVSPGVVAAHRRAARRGARWPRPIWVRAWAFALVACTLAGVVPMLAAGRLRMFGAVVGWVFVTVSWAGALASLVVVWCVTQERVSHARSHAQAGPPLGDR